MLTDEACEGYCSMLDRDDLLQNEELYYECGELINDNILTIQKEVSNLRRYFSDRRREINEESSYGYQGGDGSLKDTLKFYEQVLGELAKVELICDEYRLGMKIDLLKEARARLEIPSNACKAKPPGRRACREPRQDFSHFERSHGDSRHTWKPIPNWMLEDTRNLIVKPKAELPSAFDESDLKFKQELTLLRTKLFTLPRSQVKAYNKELMRNSVNGKKHRNSTPIRESIDIFWSNSKFEESTVESELRNMTDLKFLDGVFLENVAWSKVLDSCADQLLSKWQLVLQPQIQQLLKKRRISMLHLDACKTFEFLSRIPENGFNFELCRKALARLVKGKSQVGLLTTWKLHFQTTRGHNIAATLIQASWRGHSLRKKLWESERLYVAGSVLWFAWIVLKEKRRMHETYLTKMLASMQATKEASLELSRNFNTVIGTPHVVVHLASLGYPAEIRRGVNKKQFGMDQNACSLRISFVRNPMSHVIYVLPVKPTGDLLEMYSDLIESVSTEEDVAKRITFIALSEAETFKNRPLNLSRILHCSELSLREIRRKIGDKLAYLLPWIVDECDVRLAGNLGVALLSPSMDLQQRMLNPSRLTEMIENFGLAQPAHTRDIRDYDRLCNCLAELIVRNTEITSWIIKLNQGSEYNHCAVFFINHVSIPFMPDLRKEREAFGEKWERNAKLRMFYLNELKVQLSRILATVTRLPAYYKSWKDFYAHVVRYGCLLKAVPFHKKGSVVSVGLFLPGIGSGAKPKWTGTADELNLGKETFSAYAYMLPQTSVHMSQLAPIVNRFADALHNEGYLGYLTVNCYCHPLKYEEDWLIWIIDVHPYYSHTQSYIDWLKFAIDGEYDPATNTFIGKVIDIKKKRDSTFLLIVKAPEWDETSLRYAIFIPKVHHSRFNRYSWPQLRNLLVEKNEIVYDTRKKKGSQVLLHDSEIRDLAMMISISPTMPATIQEVTENLRKLYQALSIKTRENVNTNLLETIDFFFKLSFTYVDVSANPCA